MSGGIPMMCWGCLLPVDRCVCKYPHLGMNPFLPDLHAQPFRCAIDHNRPNPFPMEESKK